MTTFDYDKDVDSMSLSFVTMTLGSPDLGTSYSTGLVLKSLPISVGLYHKTTSVVVLSLDREEDRKLQDKHGGHMN